MKTCCDSRHVGGGDEVGAWDSTRETKVQVPAVTLVGKEHTTFQVAFIFKHFFPLANHSVVDGRDSSVQLRLAGVLNEIIVLLVDGVGLGDASRTTLPKLDAVQSTCWSNTRKDSYQDVLSPESLKMKTLDWNADTTILSPKVHILPAHSF